MAQQPSRELASANPTEGARDARFQEPGISPAISLNPRSRLQHLQRPTSSDISIDAPCLPCFSDELVARGSHCRLKTCETQAFRILRSTTGQSPRLACTKIGGANAIPKLTFQTDHSVGAGQY